MEKLVKKFNGQICPATTETVGGEITANEIKFTVFRRSFCGFSGSRVVIRGHKFKIKGGGRETTFIPE